jgi:hypothetical protein
VARSLDSRIVGQPGVYRESVPKTGLRGGEPEMVSGVLATSTAGIARRSSRERRVCNRAP